MGRGKSCRGERCAVVGNEQVARCFETAIGSCEVGSRRTNSLQSFLDDSAIVQGGPRGML